MTERRYYDHPYTREFEASVLRTEARGDRQAVWLDRSGFYPTSGGQPSDAGLLGSSTLERAEEDEHDYCGLLNSPT
ncbi:MAG: hypothetical protein GEU82_06780 [Luteitalea sp.]|nr:hypothetical protein [Luteitalea sp.]